MNKTKRMNAVYVLGSVVASLAVLVTTFNANSVCFWIAHQDALPDSAKRLRKF